MTKLIQKHRKTRCFFAKKRFHALACDSNHKKRSYKSSTIPSQRINGLTPLVNHLFLFNF
jgi:hypothetical protein